LSKPRKLKTVFLPYTLRRMAQEKLAKGLEVDLRELRTKYEAEYEAEYEPVLAVADPISEEVVVELGPRPTKPSLVYRRVHRTYLTQKGGRPDLFGVGRAGARAALQGALMGRGAAGRLCEEPVLPLSGRPFLRRFVAATAALSSVARCCSQRPPRSTSPRSALSLC
jgi:hypothetical protein